MQVAIDLPNDLVAFQGAADTRQELRTSYALWLFQREGVTLAKAAEIAGVSLYEFLTLCKSNQIPVIDMNREEFTAELEGLGKT
jgi:predicted HTH domain antitoxin